MSDRYERGRYSHTRKLFKETAPSVVNEIIDLPPIPEDVVIPLTVPDNDVSPGDLEPIKLVPEKEKVPTETILDKKIKEVQKDMERRNAPQEEVRPEEPEESEEIGEPKEPEGPETAQIGITSEEITEMSEGLEAKAAPVEEPKSEPGVITPPSTNIPPPSELNAFFDDGFTVSGAGGAAGSGTGG